MSEGIQGNESLETTVLQTSLFRTHVKTSCDCVIQLKCVIKCDFFGNNVKPKEGSWLKIIMI